MNKEVRDRWVAALRSGKFRQGTRRLRPTENTYCCLGVLCAITEDGIWDKDALGIYRYSYRGNRAKFSVPERLAQEIGLTNRVQEKLTNLNDQEGVSFEGIANYIERSL